VTIYSNNVDFYENNSPFKSRDSMSANGGASTNTTPGHLPVIRDSDKNIKRDVLEP
jgi:hypothetical protein